MHQRLANPVGAAAVPEANAPDAGNALVSQQGLGTRGTGETLPDEQVAVPAGTGNGLVLSPQLVLLALAAFHGGRVRPEEVFLLHHHGRRHCRHEVEGRESVSHATAPTHASPLAFVSSNNRRQRESNVGDRITLSTFDTAQG